MFLITLLYPWLYLATVIQWITITATTCPHMLIADMMQDTMPHHLQKQNIIYSIYTHSIPYWTVRNLTFQHGKQIKTVLLFRPTATYPPKIP